MLTNKQEKDTPCAQCNFELWEPIAESETSVLGLYNDDRFPGRSIIKLKRHKDSLEELTETELASFMTNVTIAIRAIKQATGAARVNLAILGNREPHVHAHLIPRFPEREEFPDCSPWNDRREKGKLEQTTVEDIKHDIYKELLKQT